MRPTRHQFSLAIEALNRSNGAEAGAIASELLGLIEAHHQHPGAMSRRDPVGIFERILTRRTNAQVASALRAVARAVPRVDPQQRAVIAVRLGPQLREIAAELLRSESELDAKVGLAIVGHTHDWTLVPLAAGLIGSGSGQQTHHAIEAIRACADATGRAPSIQHEVAERAIAAVLEAASQHGMGPHRAVLSVALAMLTPPARAGAFGPLAEHWLDGTHEAIRLALRTALRELPGPEGAARALELLSRPELRRAAAERIGRTRDPVEIRALYRRSHLCRRPLRREACRSRLDRGTIHALAQPDDLPLDRAEARGLPGWTDAISPQPAMRTAAIERLLAHADPAARLGAVLHGSDELRLDQCFDEHPRVAAAALLRMAVRPQVRSSISVLEPAQLGQLRRSQHAAVRRRAERLPVAGALMPVSILAARRAFERSPAAFVEQIADRITSGDPAALVLAARFGLVDQVLEPVARTLASEDARLASLAARSLAEARSEPAGELLAQALGHADARVRANAVEAIAVRSRRLRQSVAELLPDDAHHRPAATSIRELLLDGHAAPDLAERVQGLLASDDADRRAAGLWVTERAAAELKPVSGLRWAELAARVADSARRAPTVTERRRATRCARRMLAVTTDR